MKFLSNKEKEKLDEILRESYEKKKSRKRRK